MAAIYANDFSFANEPDTNLKLANQEAKRFKLVLHSGNAGMFIAMLGMLYSIFVGYIDTNNYSLWAQVTSHIMLILFATAIKIGYVMRCIGLHGLHGLGATQL
ncbi:hypothetical protein [Shewanella sp. UCD-KL12]|uniref:hypothetical protein n=1 Tax=Shewanella sp. UCD-KL12 TaxID=1917163 RepID=UPI00097143FD|nr:hypothetical protein [Shewanella sp. UCD-KL12]